MAGKGRKQTQAPSVVSGSRTVPARIIPGIILLTVATLALIAIWDFDLGQSRSMTTEHEEMANKIGLLGAEFSFYSFRLIGVATWLFPLYLVVLSVRCFTTQKRNKRLIVSLSSLASLLLVAGLAAIAENAGAVLPASESVFRNQLSHFFGGDLGHLFGVVMLQPLIGPVGAAIILVMCLVITSILVLTDDVGNGVDYVKGLWVRWRERLDAARAARAERRASAAQAAPRKTAAAPLVEPEKKMRRSWFGLNKATNDADNEESGVDLLSGVSVEAGAKPASAKKGRKPKLSLRGENEPEVESLDEDVEEPLEEPVKKPPFNPDSLKIISGSRVEKAVGSIPERRGDYVFPPLDLLAEPGDTTQLSPEDHRETMEALVRTLDEFGVKVLPGEIHTGPVITRYEVTPAPGVRVEKIVNLDKNLALGLRAMSVRILAPVPGKGSVGVEVPNRVASAVCMREIVESRAWAESKAEIPVVLGKDVTGIPIVTDLTKMPHVLIAGSTGSGKTVCINAVIASLLYHSGPEDLRFIMIDPKVVEMQVYNDLPHMLIPVVTEAKKVPGALKWLIAEMERRYQIFAKENVRNIASFNAKIEKNKEQAERAAEMDADMTAHERHAISQVEVPRDDDAFEVPRQKLPYIVCVIDELADLMMVAPADIETCIARLAQLARAAGIHLILATQRPSVNVITGVIKANLPCRISFKVASKVDSRTILDGGGAEALIGKGDMLFIPPGTSNLTRAQGAFVSDEEINAIVDFIKDKNEPPVFAEEIQRQIESESEEGDGVGGDADGAESDDLLPDAIEVLRATKRASTSMLQRRLRIGYNRAARLMEILEDRGIVGPENGSSPREILVDLDA